MLCCPFLFFPFSSSLLLDSFSLPISNFLSFLFFFSHGLSFSHSLSFLMLIYPLFSFRFVPSSSSYFIFLSSSFLHSSLPPPSFSLIVSPFLSLSLFFILTSLVFSFSFLLSPSSSSKLPLLLLLIFYLSFFLLSLFLSSTSHFFSHGLSFSHSLSFFMLIYRLFSFRFRTSSSYFIFLSSSSLYSHFLFVRLLSRSLSFSHFFLSCPSFSSDFLLSIFLYFFSLHFRLSHSPPPSPTPFFARFHVFSPHEFVVIFFVLRCVYFLSFVFYLQCQTNSLLS
ncbi:unnamed protein product [Acanthosepion pharaonis]|uniref:Uncharacterized protein n=1 Tax=Acanthosepion pharaonis TaxID=158019 RepID=A0A812F136_ACAPH|nr:unnamed protein product [Sepia pharaonis]